MAKRADEGAVSKARRNLAAKAVDGVARHVLLCSDTRKEGCAGAKRMRRAWNHLVGRLEEVCRDSGSRVLATRTRCFGICEAGPIAVVYPDGVWYGGCDPGRRGSLTRRFSRLLVAPAPRASSASPP